MTDDQALELGDGWHELAVLSCLTISAVMTPAGFAMAAPGYWSKRFGEYELALEPLTFGRWALALYRGRELMLEQKLTVHVS